MLTQAGKEVFASLDKSPKNSYEDKSCQAGFSLSFPYKTGYLSERLSEP